MADLQPIGILEGAKRLDLVIGLPLRNKALLASLLQEIYNPASPQYRHYLTPERFTELFGPSEEDYQGILAFAQSHRLTVTGTAPNRVLVDVNGAVTDIENAFRVRLRVYKHPREARTFFATDVEPTLDLAVPVLAISGLSDYVLPKPLSHRKRFPTTGPGSTPNGGSGKRGSYMGTDFRNAYIPGMPLAGSGQTVGLLEFDGYYPNDIIAYETQANLPNVTLTNVLLNSVSGTPSTNAISVGEVSLDIEMAISMAPGLSQVVVYEGTNPTDMLNRMATDNLAKQLSSSWAFATEGAGDFISQFAAQFAAQGQTFFQSSGDDGAYYLGISYWAANPNVTLVGGTVLTTGTDGSWQSEAAWSGSGGGVSLVNSYPIPSWQYGLSNAANQASTTLRNSPDVAMVAEDVWVIYNDGSTGAFYGTSIGAPLWAGLTALINQQAAANGQGAVGFLNPALYSIGKGVNYTNCFHDITSGNNGVYSAVSGYDLCTGWGTPNGTSLINLLALRFTYTINDGTITIMGYTGSSGAVTIPSEINNLPVTNIGTNAFYGCTNLTSVTIPNSVASIGDHAFYFCNSLRGVYFQGNAPSVGSSVFASDNNATVYYLPGTKGWGATLGGLPTALWFLPNPLILNTGPSFGVQTNGFGFIISWATNISVAVDTCTNLANPAWSPLQTNILTDGWLYFIDPCWTNSPIRFYRVRSP